MDFIEQLGDLITAIHNGIQSFIDFILNLPALIYNLLDLIPEPVFSIISAFIGFVIFIILIKVVRLFVS